MWKERWKYQLNNLVFLIFQHLSFLEVLDTDLCADLNCLLKEPETGRSYNVSQHFVFGCSSFLMVFFFNMKRRCYNLYQTRCIERTKWSTDANFSLKCCKVLWKVSCMHAAQVAIYCSDTFCASWAAEPFGIITKHEWRISLHNKPLSQPGCVIVAVETPRQHDTDLKHFYIEVFDWYIFGV